MVSAVAFGTTATLSQGVTTVYAINDNNETYVAWVWDAGANSIKTYTVKVVSDSGNKYRFDDFGTSAVTLDLEEGSTYVFDQSDSSNIARRCAFPPRLMERTTAVLSTPQA